MTQNFFDGLSEEKKKELKKQIERFNIKKKEKRNIVNFDKNIILNEGTLIHGTSFNKDVVSNISNSGIITGQYFNIPEDGETYFCADFFRVEKDTNLKDYNKNFQYNDGRCPFGNLGKNQIAFLIYPDERLDDITKYDCYKNDGFEAKITQDFVNVAGLPVENEKKASSILFGVPSNFINGIILGDNVINETNIEFLIEKFPGVFFSRNNGTMLYKYGDTDELWRLRTENAEKCIKYENELNNSKKFLNQIKELEEEKEKMWSAISTLSIEDISKIYSQLGWQGNCKEYASDLKEHYNSIDKKIM